MNEIIKGNPNLLADPTVRKWHQKIVNGDKDDVIKTVLNVVNAFTQGRLPEVLIDQKFTTSVWEKYLKAAEEFNNPGRFSAIIGYEWTSNPGGQNLHRNVIYRDGADKARQKLPYTVAESANPEDLWKWLEAYEQKTGGRVLALAHNGNISNGIDRKSVV